MKSINTILLTGFDPFGGRNVNISGLVVSHLAESQPIKGLEIISKILPVDKDNAPMRLIDAIIENRPHAILCLGEASRRSSISIERVALNLLDFRIPDNLGNQPIDQPILPEGPAAYFSTLPVRKIFTAIHDQGIPAELSLNAGTFVCNQVMYCLMHFLTVNHSESPGGFIHLPALLSHEANEIPCVPSLPLEMSITAIEIAIRTICSANKKHGI